MTLSVEKLWNHIQAIRQEKPLIQNITNYVVMNSTANALLAIGASPVMTHLREEMEDMVAMARGLVLNIGTADSAWVDSMKIGAAKAKSLGIPVVLDPVGVGATPYRTQTALTLLETGAITAIRGNASEIHALAGARVKTKGVDSTLGSESALEGARKLVAGYDCVVCVSGAVDYVVDSVNQERVDSGDPLMTQITGMGCTASALCGAFLAVGGSPFEAVFHAMTLMGVGGEIAAARGNGPGTFWPHFLDILHYITREELKKGLQPRGKA